MKPSASPQIEASENLSQSSLTKFYFGEQHIIPVETSTYQTIDFRNPEYENSIIYSTSLSACAVVLIKNSNEETGKYDNIVTMGHFYPANAYNTDKAKENLEKIMQDFEICGGSFSQKTSVILIGGGLVQGENIMETTPLGSLLSLLGKELPEEGKQFKFTHHTTSINNLTGEINPNHPETQDSDVFVNKDGTAITGCTRRKSDGVSAIRLLTTKSIDSMPLGLLTEIKSCNYSFYPKEVGDFMSKRSIKIVSLMNKEPKPDLTISKMEAVLEKFFELRNRGNEGR